jgi:tetratricopeptide (TPR) repeat protein
MAGNVLYYGDNLHVLRKWVADESVDLIYLDPPFNSKKVYNQIYKDSKAQERVFKDSLQIDGEDDRALAEYRTALALGPSQVVHNNIAVIEMARGQWSDAERDLRAELALNPEYGKAYGNLGIVLRHQGRLDEACAAAGEAVERDPEDEAWRRAGT